MYIFVFTDINKYLLQEMQLISIFCLNNITRSFRSMEFMSSGLNIEICKGLIFTFDFYHIAVWMCVYHIFSFVSLKMLSALNTIKYELISIWSWGKCFCSFLANLHSSLSTKLILSRKYTCVNDANHNQFKGSYIHTLK